MRRLPQSGNSSPQHHHHGKEVKSAKWLRVFVFLIVGLWIVLLLFFSKSSLSLIKQQQQQQQQQQQRDVHVQEAIRIEEEEEEAAAAYEGKVPMPWETGLWRTRKNSSSSSSSSRGKQTSKPPSLAEAAAYAQCVQWDRGQGENEHRSRRKTRQANAAVNANANAAAPRSILFDKGKQLRLLHVLNPFPTRNKANEATQNLTMASVETARAWIEYMDPFFTFVDVVTIEYPELMPPPRPTTFSRAAVNLSTSAIHVIGDKLSKQAQRRPMPLLKDVLMAGLREAQVEVDPHRVSNQYDYVIYSNIDIHVMPHFYLVVREMISCYKMFFLNRVEIPDFKVKGNLSSFHLGGNYSALLPSEPLGLHSLKEAFEYVLSFSQQHPGYDCLVVPIDKIAQIASSVGQVFVGFPPVGGILAEAARIADINCAAAKRCPATFHIGTRNGDWEGSDSQEYIALNGELAQVAKGRSKKRKKCKPILVKANDAKDKCYPSSVYPLLAAPNNAAMFPQDYAAMQALKNFSSEAHRLSPSSYLKMRRYKSAAGAGSKSADADQKMARRSSYQEKIKNRMSLRGRVRNKGSKGKENYS